MKIEYRTSHPLQHHSQQGFTLIELMIVLTMIVILAGISIPAYQQSILRAKETTLRQDLYSLRNAIDQYTLDKAKAPQSLDDLVSAGYLRSLPKDPFTNSETTWTTENEESTTAVEQNEPGISNVHSGAEQSASDGSAYNTW